MPPTLTAESVRWDGARIRSFVRRWINEWDLRRLYPESEPDIEVTELQLRYGEDRALEQPASDDLDLPIIGEAGTPPIRT